MNEDDVQFDPAALGDELMELVVLYLEGRLTGPQRDRLNSLLAEDPSNRDTFVAVCTHASLLASCVGIDEGVDEDVEGLGVVGLPAIDASVGEASERRGMAGSPAIGGEAGFGVRDSGFEVRDLSLLARQLNYPLARQLNCRTNLISNLKSPIHPFLHSPLSPPPSPLISSAVGRSPAWSPR